MQIFKTILLLALLLSWTSCQKDATESTLSPNAYHLIPKPGKLIAKTGQFRLDSNTKIVQKGEKETTDLAAEYLEGWLQNSAGITAKVEEGEPDKDFILLEQDNSITHEEGYRLSISPYEITIRAKTGAGAFYAVQTLQQLIATKKQGEYLDISCVDIADAPRFAYRGMHLDVCRHFFPPDFIKRYIDLLAMHKMNRFHWHLTEDQGWRIEIKKYPKLQEIAAFRDETLIGHYNDQPHQFDGKRYGGFYTQEEIKDIVAYAQARYITIIPEIEMPGHSSAALAAYPELGCGSGPYKAATKWGVFEEVYCPTEETFTFLEGVLTEVMALFPSEYIHIGGDECPKTAWKKSAFCQDLIRRENLKDEHGLQSYFIRRMEQFLNKNGRQIIGWDEILEGGLAPNATVMSWRGTEGGIEAARQKHKVIMTPTSHCYFDYYQSSSPEEPIAIGGFLPLKKVYNYEPIPEELTEEEASYILGAQGNVWTEYIPTTEQVEYMAFPRAIALAEVLWSDKSQKDYTDFAQRLVNHLPRLDERKVNYADHIYEVNATFENGEKGVAVNLQTLATDAIIHYTLDGTAPSNEAPAYQEAIIVKGEQELQAQVFRAGKSLGKPSVYNFDIHLAAGKPITLENPPAPAYSHGGEIALLNGIMGSEARYGDGEWLGWSGNDVVATIDLQAPTDAKKVSLRFYNANGQWIYLPRKVEVFTSLDGKDFTKVGEAAVLAKTTSRTKQISIPLPATATQWIKVKVTRYGVIPEGQGGAGHEAWLFLDELRVE